LTSTPDLDPQVRDVVGDRVLTGIQLIDISRLSAHPVPMINGGLVTIAGQGPKDSNGAGKSSFIAAISLLSGDEQWRLAGGASSAAELLFTAEVAAQDGRWSNVDHGYVIGVFTDPRACDAESWTSSALSVWLRINRKAPYLDLRWEDGLYVPAGASEVERVARVDELWARMDRRRGRTDLHANRLADSLYGSHVRCVSFLSTSVRASPTANLLAQPLNELTPFRIFDAIATLTGLDRELEQEQELRGKEFLERDKVVKARADLERWEQQMAVVGAGIERRAAARTQLERSRALFRNHTAAHVLEGHEERLRITTRTAELLARKEERQRELATLRDTRDALRDEGFDERCAAAEMAWKRLQERDQELAATSRQHGRNVEELQRGQGQLRDQSREADGRDVTGAREERHEAERRLTAATEQVGAARRASQDAADRLARTEAGKGLAAEQLRRLDPIPAASLMDIVTLDERERDTWEPRLVPYREAVVVSADHLDDALERLARLPGSMLVLAGPAPDERRLPESADPRLDLGRFLAALADRAPDGTADGHAGVIVLGGFPDPTTGRAARIALARAALERAETALGEDLEAAADARRQLGRAERRLRGAGAVEELIRVGERIRTLREDAERVSSERDELRSALATAQAAFIEISARRQNRQEELDRLGRSIGRLVDLQHDDELERAELARQDAQIGMEERLRRWGGTVEDASGHVLALDEAAQRRGAEDWARDACDELTGVLESCFGTAEEEHIPREVREHLDGRAWHRGTPEHRRETFPGLSGAVRTYVAQTEEQDRLEKEQIERQRRERTSDLAVAEDGLREASATAEAHRSSLGAGIRARLKRVAEEFDRLDREHGGHGASLEYPEPEPPAEPDRPWRWRVVPKWRRAEGQRYSPYNLRGNTALMDEKAVKLVCAAALAGGSDRPLLLILDELGRNLGKQHRREAVALFEQIGRSRDITVIGALQDDMERYAIDASGLYIKLRRGSDAQPYNDAPAVVGHDVNSERVGLLQDWLSAFRPGAPGPGSGPGDGSLALEEV
jgi:chromosome segregation protein